MAFCYLQVRLLQMALHKAAASCIMWEIITFFRSSRVKTRWELLVYIACGSLEMVTVGSKKNQLNWIAWMPREVAEKCGRAVKSSSRCCFPSLNQAAMALWSVISQSFFTQAFGTWWLLILLRPKFIFLWYCLPYDVQWEHNTRMLKLSPSYLNLPVFFPLFCCRL